MKPPARLEAEPGEDDEPAVDCERDAAVPHRDPEHARIVVPGAGEAAIEALEEPAEEAVHHPREDVGLAPWGLSSTAASAGERVSELNAEITVEMAMVSANCR